MSVYVEIAAHKVSHKDPLTVSQYEKTHRHTFFLKVVLAQVVSFFTQANLLHKSYDYKAGRRPPLKLLCDRYVILCKVLLPDEKKEVIMCFEKGIKSQRILYATLPLTCKQGCLKMISLPTTANSVVI